MKTKQQKENRRIMAQSTYDDKDRCCFSECKDRAEKGIGNNLNEGKLFMCKECFDKYEEHCKAREKCSEITCNNKASLCFECVSKEVKEATQEAKKDEIKFLKDLYYSRFMSVVQKKILKKLGQLNKEVEER